MADLPEQMIIYSVQSHGVLPLTSACNVNCVFCSNRQNPPGVQTYNIPPRPMAEIEATLEYLVPGEKIVIGESATRINEGEPFTHPRIREILTLVRQRFPTVPLQVTTNGSLLAEDTLAYLAGLAPLELNLSINSANPAVRTSLLGDSQAATAIRAAERLSAYGIPYHGSLVALPQLTGWDDIRQTVSYLEQHRARTLRVFLPGYTRLASPAMHFPPSFHRELQAYVEGLRPSFRLPLLLEPPLLSDLAARVEGILADSPAAASGLCLGDIITRVDGRAVRTRVEAFNQSRKGENPELTIQRGSAERQLKLVKEPGQRPGLVLSYDIDPDRVAAAVRLVRKHRAKKVLILTSALAATVVRLALRALMPDGTDWQVAVCPSLCFGGSIQSAGLLTVDDLVAAGREWEHWQPDLLLVPSTPFDFRGRDLVGRSYRETGEELGLPLELV